MRRKNIFAAIAIFVLLLTLVIYASYNKKPQSAKGQTADLHVEATTLIDAYADDEQAANTKYLGKLLQVSGTIIRIDNHADTLMYIIMGSNSNGVSQLRCALEKTQLETVKKLSANTRILVKGYCIGYLMDVEMNRCVIVNN